MNQQPDVVHFVDPIWLGAQTLIAMELGWAGEEWVSEEGPAMGAGIRGAVVASYHTYVFAGSDGTVTPDRISCSNGA